MLIITIALLHYYSQKYKHNINNINVIIYKQAQNIF